MTSKVPGSSESEGLGELSRDSVRCGRAGATIPSVRMTGLSPPEAGLGSAPGSQPRAPGRCNGRVTRPLNEPGSNSVKRDACYKPAEETPEGWTPDANKLPLPSF